MRRKDARETHIKIEIDGQVVEMDTRTYVFSAEHDDGRIVMGYAGSNIEVIGIAYMMINKIIQQVFKKKSK
jgi:hypothetical protein